MIRESISYTLLEVERLVNIAKQEPAHSPTEDALIDAVDSLADAVGMLLRAAQGE